MQQAIEGVAKQSLLSKVSLLLSGSLALSGLGTYLGRDIGAGGSIVLMILFLTGAFIIPSTVKKNPSVGRWVMLAWVFESGLFLGPAIHQYVHVLGWQTVFLSYLGSAVIMLACGAYGVLAKRDFQSWNGWLFLFLLIIFAISLVSIVVSLGVVGNTIFSIAGMMLFALFFIVDFQRAAKGEDNWANAVVVTMNLYLDFINFWLFFLRLLGINIGSKD